MIKKKQDLNKISPERLLKGIKLTVDNASKLFNAANILKATKNFGIANSLYILCCEEAIKAFALYNKFIIDDDRDIQQYFKDHSKKLELLKEGYHLISSETKAMKVSFDKAIQKTGMVDTKKIENEAKRIHKEIYNKYLNDTSEIEKNKNWWQKQNETKQRGFYVGFKNSDWESPDSITENEVDITGQITINILGHVLQYKDLDIKVFRTK